MPSLCYTSLDKLIGPSNSLASSQAGPSGDRSTLFSVYPALYATPSHQRPPSPTAFSPSPYVLNFKRRAPVLPQQNDGRGNDAKPSIQPASQQECHQTGDIPGNDAAVILEKLGRIEDRNHGTTTEHQDVLVSENEVFEMELENRETSPCRSRSLDKDSMAICNGNSVSFDHGAAATPTSATASRCFVGNEEAEFFDAAESVFSESANEDEMYSTSAIPGRSLWTKLEDEKVRRMKAEEHAEVWQRRWNKMAKHCAAIGVSIPFEVDDDSSEYAGMMNQEFLIARLVGEAVARASVRAEKEEQLEHLIGMKNQEICRLWDKLQYLELVNREMSQRNQEVTELTHRRKRKRQKRQKLVLSGFCAAFCIGSAGFLSCKYFPWDQAKALTDLFLKSRAVEGDST